MNAEKLRLDDVCLKITDGSHYSPQDQEEGFIMLSSKDMRENGFDYTNVKYISENDYQKLVKGDCKPLKNDILIIKDGNSYLKRIFMCQEEREEVVLSSIAIVRPNTEIVNPKYLTYFLKSETVKDEMALFLSGAAIPRIILDDFKKVRVLVPPLSVQHQVADILWRYDSLIDNYQQQISALEGMAQELYREWFVRGRCPYAQPGEAGTLPVGWEKKRVQDCFDILGGGTPTTEESSYWEDGDVNWFTPTDITGGNSVFLAESSQKITSEGLKNSSARMFPAYSVMMTSRATIGAISINSKPASTNQGFIVCLPNETYPYSFIYFWIKHNKHIIEMLASGATFLEIPKGIFKNVELISPTPDVLSTFNKLTMPLFGKIEKLQTQLTYLRQMRDALLPRLLSGQLDVSAGTLAEPEAA